MLHVIATIELTAGKREAFLERFHALVPLVRAENGCVEYGPAVDLQTSFSIQPPVRENTVTVMEKWDDLQALEVHLAAPHMAEFRNDVKDFVTSTVIQVLEPA